jgi:hypothetical protein
MVVATLNKVRKTCAINMDKKSTNSPQFPAKCNEALMLAQSNLVKGMLENPDFQTTSEMQPRNLIFAKNVR